MSYTYIHNGIAHMDEILSAPATIYTHNGIAHMDEILSAAAIMRCEQDRQKRHVVVKRVSEVEERDISIDDYVVDIGGEYCPQRRRFDHHHDEELDCSLVLVCKYLGYHDVLKNEAWYQFININDRRGPMAAARELGVERIPWEVAPVGGAVKRMFAKEPNRILPFVTSIFNQLFDDAVSINEMVANVRSNMVGVAAAGLRGFLVNSSEIPAVKRVAEEDGYDFNACISNRTWTYTLCRIDKKGDPKLDFRLAKDHKDVTFVHNSGFMAATSLEPGGEGSFESLLEIARMARVEEES